MTARRAIALAAVALALAGCDLAGTREPQAPPSPAMWEVTSPAGDKAWLLGSMHALASGTKWRTPAFDAAFAQSGALVLEVAELADPQKLGDAFERLAVSPGQGLVSSRVPAADRARVIETIEDAGYDDDDFRALETWAVALTLSSELNETGVGVDRQLLEERGSRPLHGLETVADQYGAFDGLSAQDQAALLVAVVQEADRPQDRSARAEAWRLGDLETLEQETHRGMLADPEIRQALLVARNAEWIDDIERLVASGERPMIVVGTGHVVGKEGIPALLEARGYTLRRVQ